MTMRPHRPLRAALARLAPGCALLLALLAACAPMGGPPPQAPQAAPQAAQERTTVYVHNPNGSRTPVVLTRVGPDQWRGPRGESYHGLPGEDALRPAYGLR